MSSSSKAFKESLISRLRAGLFYFCVTFSFRFEFEWTEERTSALKLSKFVPQTVKFIFERLFLRLFNRII